MKEAQEAKEALEKEIKERDESIQLTKEALEESKKFKKAIAEIFF
jgi:hypothetical protein